MLNPILACFIGVVAIVPVELIAMRSRDVALAWVVATLLFVLALVVGAAIGAAEWIARRASLPPLPSALLRSAASLIVMFPVARHLFDGGKAASLPMAGSGPIWFPLLVWLLIAAAILVARRLPPRPTGALLAAGAVAVEWANRNLYTGDYLDVHGGLVVTSCVLAGLAARLLLPARRSHARATVALAALTIVSFVLIVGHGLQTSTERWVVATRGTHTRHLLRVARALVGSSAIGGYVDTRTAAGPPPPAALAVPAGWRAQPGVASVLEAARHYNVLLISLDALRFDTLADRDRYPNLARLMDESHVFRRAFAVASATDVSLPTFLTGRLNPYLPERMTLPEALHASGWRTLAVIPTETLRWVGRSWFTRGVDTMEPLVNDEGHEDLGSYSTSARTTDLGLALAGAAPRPMFLWLHYFDIHEHLEIDDDDRALAAQTGGRKLGTVEKYRALVAVVDGEIGRLRAELERRNLWNDTVVVVLSDHGEGLKSDPRLGDTHGAFIYNTLTHVPLFIRVPGVPPGVTDDPVSLIDVAFTICSLVGAPWTSGRYSMDLLPYVLRGPRPSVSRVITLTESRQYGVIAWPWKLMIRPGENLIELYDLSRDMAELDNVADSQPDRVRALRALYRSMPTPTIDRTPEARRQREATARAHLGY